MHIMRHARSNSRAAAKEATHERIVSVAARAIRRSDYDGTGVADIMKDAGLTHGAFYSHFESREAMLAEAAARACAESAAAASDVVAAVPPKKALASMLGAYLSREHVEHAEVGCPLAALGSETPRQVPEVRRVTTRHIKETRPRSSTRLPPAAEKPMNIVYSLAFTHDAHHAPLFPHPAH